MQDDLIVRTGRIPKHNLPGQRHGQNRETVVIGVLTDQVDAPGGADHRQVCFFNSNVPLPTIEPPWYASSVPFSVVPSSVPLKTTSYSP